jgi:imidazolonepropionase-like amidohydrolase
MGMQSIEHLVTVLENEMALREDPAPTQAAAVARLQGPRGQGVLDALMRNRTYLDPTLVHYENRLRSADPAAAAAVRPLFMRARAFVGAAQAAGVNILAGTDERAAPGAALWDELDLLVASGLSPRQALRAATSTAAQAANRATLGRLTVGAPASFIVIDGDPSADIRAVRRLWMVVLGGRLLDADELARLRS